MIACFRCSCGGSERMIRRALQKGGLPNWLSVPIAVGKNQSLDALAALDIPQDNLEIRSLKRFLSETSKFAVILGEKNGIIRWANLSDGSPTSKLDAEVIIEKLA